MRILFVSWLFPYPPHTGGRQRIFNFIRALSKLNKVDGLDFLCLYNKDTNIQTKEIEVLKSFCSNVFLVENSDIHLRKYHNIIFHDSFFIRLAYHISSLKPAGVRYLYSSKLIKTFYSLNPDSYDIIWVERIPLAEMFKKFGKKIVVDLDDIEHVKKKRELKCIDFYPSLLLEYFDLLKLEFFEKRAYKHFSKVVVCSKKDKHYLGNHNNIFVLPNVVELPSLSKKNERLEEENTIVFVGTMDYYPNTDAMVYFCSEIFPHLKEINKDIKLYIVGARPPQEVTRFHNNRDIIVTGYVSNVETYITKASVVVVPIRIGGGTRIKILEALAFKKAVVSTNIGAEGLEVESGKNIIIEDDPKKFAEKVAELLKDKQKRKFLGENGRRLVEQKYSLEVLLKEISSVIG